MIRAALTAALLLLSACGFAPIYGDNTVSAPLGQISIASIPDRDGQYLRNALLDRFYRNGTPADPAYILQTAAIGETRTDLDITKNSAATRAQLKLETTITLRDRSTNREVLHRKLSAVGSYNVLQSQFTTRVSEDSARRAALDNLAQQIERHLSLYFSRPGGIPAPGTAQ